MYLCWPTSLKSQVQRYKSHNLFPLSDFRLSESKHRIALSHLFEAELQSTERSVSIEFISEILRNHLKKWKLFHFLSSDLDLLFSYFLCCLIYCDCSLFPPLHISSSWLIFCWYEASSFFARVNPIILTTSIMWNEKGHKHISREGDTKSLDFKCNFSPSFAFDLIWMCIVESQLVFREKATQLTILNRVSVWN